MELTEEQIASVDWILFTFFWMLDWLSSDMKEDWKTDERCVWEAVCCWRSIDAEFPDRPVSIAELEDALMHVVSYAIENPRP